MIAHLIITAVIDDRERFVTGYGPAAARAFWTSPDHAEVRKLREGIADATVLLI